MEAELGPINYIAELFYGETVDSNIDDAVRIIILLLIFVFDPLAIIMVLAANIGIKEMRGSRPIAVAKVPERVMETVDDDEIQTSAVDPEDWVAEKYGVESAMDKKKERGLQWLIDKKRKRKE